MTMYDDFFDRYDPFDDEPHDVGCRNCGKHGLQWQHDGARWVLINEAGTPHVCNEANVRKRTLDDFEDLDA